MEHEQTYGGTVFLHIIPVEHLLLQKLQHLTKLHGNSFAVLYAPRKVAESLISCTIAYNQNRN
jgi:hypothetical protein